MEAEVARAMPHFSTVALEEVVKDLPLVCGEVGHPIPHVEVTA